MNIYATYCSQTKSSKQFGTPQQLYLAQRVQSFFARFPKPRVILSYKYGIVPENEIIDNYEQKGFHNIEKAAQAVQDYINYNTLIFYSPRELTEGPWILLLTLANIKYKIIRSYKELNQFSLTEFMK